MMKRILIVIIGGEILGVIYIACCAWLLLKFTIFGKIATESAAIGRVMEYKEVVSKFGQNTFWNMQTELRLIQYVMFPLLSVLIGIYVGVYSIKNEVAIAAITILPFVIFATSSDSSRVAAFGFSIFYLGICCLATNVIARRRTTRQASQVVSNQEDAPDQKAAR